MFLTHLLHDVRREDSRRKGSAENVGEFFVQASDSHLLKVPVWVDDRLSRLLGLRLPCECMNTNYSAKYSTPRPCYCLKNNDNNNELRL